MALSEDEAKTILNHLIMGATIGPDVQLKGESQLRVLGVAAVDVRNSPNEVVQLPSILAIGKAYNEIVSTHNALYPAQAPEAPKKKRKKSSRPGMGWPAGLSRKDYAAWKGVKQAEEYDGQISPQACAREMGLLNSGAVTGPHGGGLYSDTQGT